MDESRRVKVEVFSPPALMLEGLCTSCEVVFGASGVQDEFRQAQFETYPDDLVQEAARFNGMVNELVDRHHGEVVVKILNPQSVEGLWKAIRHGLIREYPTWLVEGEKYAGWDEGQIDVLIDRHKAKEVE